MSTKNKKSEIDKQEELNDLVSKHISHLTSQIAASNDKLEDNGLIADGSDNDNTANKDVDTEEFKVKDNEGLSNQEIDNVVVEKYDDSNDELEDVTNEDLNIVEDSVSADNVTGNDNLDDTNDESLNINEDLEKTSIIDRKNLVEKNTNDMIVDKKKKEEDYYKNLFFKAMKIIGFIFALYYILLPFVTRMTLDSAYLHYYGEVNPGFHTVALSYVIFPIISIIIGLLLGLRYKSKRVIIGSVLTLVASILIIVRGPLNYLLYGKDAIGQSPFESIFIGLLALIGASLFILEEHLKQKELNEKKKLEEALLKQEQEEKRNEEQRKKDEIKERISAIKNKTNQEKVVTIQHHHSLQDSLNKQDVSAKEIDEEKVTDAEINDSKATRLEDDPFYDVFDNKIIKLKKAKALHDHGIITDEEFDKLKQEIIDG